VLEDQRFAAVGLFFWFFVTLGATFEALFFLYLSDYQ
jgi:hypothetical protein